MSEIFLLANHAWYKYFGLTTEYNVNTLTSTCTDTVDDDLDRLELSLVSFSLYVKV